MEHPNLRVLVVDGELLIRWSVAETLSTAGHVVVQASDGQSAMVALRSDESVDVVLLDYRLPDSNDLTLLGTIRREAPQAAVVVMTAYGTPDVVSGALQLGAHDVLTKPFDMHALDSVVMHAYSTRPS